jgi:rubrerythrin
MDLETLLQRLRQLHAVDKNALAIYSDLAGKVEDPGLQGVFQRLIRDEARHVALEKELFSLCEQAPDS